MSNYDPFMDQKQMALDQSMDAVRSLAKFFYASTNSIETLDNSKMQQLFSDFIQVKKGTL